MVSWILFNCHNSWICSGKRGKCRNQHNRRRLLWTVEAVLWQKGNFTFFPLFLKYIKPGNIKENTLVLLQPNTRFSCFYSYSGAPYHPRDYMYVHCAGTKEESWHDQTRWHYQIWSCRGIYELWLGEGHSFLTLSTTSLLPPRASHFSRWTSLCPAACQGESAA